MHHTSKFELDNLLTKITSIDNATVFMSILRFFLYCFIVVALKFLKSFSNLMHLTGTEVKGVLLNSAKSRKSFAHDKFLWPCLHHPTLIGSLGSTLRSHQPWRQVGRWTWHRFDLRHLRRKHPVRVVANSFQAEPIITSQL